MSWPDTSAATATSPHMDIESTHQGLTWDLDLKLLIDMVFIDRATALRTLLGQRHIEDLVWLVFRQRAMGLGTVLVCWLAARRFRVLLGRALGERGGLSFLSPCGLIQKLLQFGDPSFEPRTVRAPRRYARIINHTTDIGKIAAYP